MSLADRRSQENTMKSINAVIIISVLSLAVPISFAQSGTGSIQGTVTSEDGTSIDGAAVSYGRLVTLTKSGTHVEPAPGETSVSGSVNSDATGAFVIPNLPIGRYIV